MLCKTIPSPQPQAVWMLALSLYPLHTPMQVENVTSNSLMLISKIKHGIILNYLQRWSGNHKTNLLSIIQPSLEAV
jgi:hypothetical protein